jgi:hypothetical protein
MKALRKLREQASERGDQCLAMLLGGVELYVSVGREWELLEIMRQFAHNADEMVRNTPTASDLKRLYEETGPEA